MSRSWKEIKVESNDNVWDREEPLEGRLIKAEENVGPNNSMMYTIKTDDEEVKVWGSKVLDDKLLGVPRNTYIQIVYKGKVKGKNSSYHDFSVSIDEDDMGTAEAEEDTEEKSGSTQPQSGYEKAREAAKNLGKDKHEDNNEDEPISVDDIPF